jgi:hypothetical protein
MEKKYVGIVLALVFVGTLFLLSGTNVPLVVATSSSTSDCIQEADATYTQEMIDWIAEYPNGGWDSVHDLLDINTDYNIRYDECIDGSSYNRCMMDCDRGAKHYLYSCQEGCEGSQNPSNCMEDCDGCYEIDYEDCEDECSP